MRSETFSERRGPGSLRAGRSGTRHPTVSRCGSGTCSSPRGQGVLLTTYRSDGTEVAVAAPFDEVSVTAEDSPQLLDQVWSALNPAYRVAAAVLDPVHGPSSLLHVAATAD